MENNVSDPLSTYTAWDGDPRFLKAADYENYFGNGLAIFDMCARAKDGCPCGLYCCSHLWWRPDPNRYKFKCHIAYWLLSKDDWLYKQLAQAFGCERNASSIEALEM